MDHRFANFISETVIELLDYQIDIQFVNKRYLENSSGYFNESPREFKVAVRKPFKFWFPVYIHEYSHFKQWIEKDPLWDAYDHRFVDWLDGDFVVMTKMKQSMKSVVLTELDCEKRVLDTIIKKELPIDPKKFVKSANAHLLAYSYCYKFKDWFNECPYEDEKIVKQMPDYFLSDREYLKTHSKYDKIFEKLFD